MTTIHVSQYSDLPADKARIQGLLEEAQTLANKYWVRPDGMNLIKTDFNFVYEDLEETLTKLEAINIEVVEGEDE